MLKNQMLFRPDHAALRYVYDESGINVSLQAAGAVIRDSFNALGSRGCHVRDQLGNSVPKTNGTFILKMFNPTVSPKNV